MATTNNLSPSSTSFNGNTIPSIPSRVEGEPLNLVPQSGELSFILSHVRSLLSKVQELETVLRSSFINMAFITETWLSENIHDSADAFDGYSLVRRDRVNKLGGGVCAYTKSSIPFKVLQHLQDEYFESLWLYLRPYKLPRGFSCLIVCVIYHPPASDNNALIDHITSKLDLALIKHPNAGIFLVGDFNRCPVSALLRHFGLKQIVKQPTRKKVILDLILTNMSDCCNPTSVISPIGLSDHNSVICTFNRSLIKNVTNKVKIRRNIHVNKTAFGKWLAEYNWSTLYRTVTCEDKLDIFMKVINTGLDCFFPCKSIKLHANDKP